MKSTPSSRALISLGASLLLTGAVAMAQTASPQTPLAQTPLAQTPAAALDVALPAREFKVSNVPVNIMAWWLDPKGQPMPLQIQFSIANAGRLPSQFTNYDNPFLRQRLPTDASTADRPPAIPQ